MYLRERKGERIVQRQRRTELKRTVSFRIFNPRKLSCSSFLRNPSFVFLRFFFSPLLVTFTPSSFFCPFVLPVPFIFRRCPSFLFRLTGSVYEFFPPSLSSVYAVSFLFFLLFYNYSNKCLAYYISSM